MLTESSILERIRPAVRSEKQYRVRSYPAIEAKLNQNESPYDLPESLKQEVLSEMVSVPFNRYPDDQPGDLESALAEMLGVNPEGILVGNGSNELTHTLGLALMADGKVLLPSPLFALFRSVVRLFGGQLTEITCLEDLSFDMDRIITTAGQLDPDLTVIATPNNPTGLEVNHSDLQRLVETARGFVLVDEAYVEFSEQPDAISLMQKHPNVLIMRTLSKGFGLAGLRIGYLIGRPSVISELRKARLPFMIGELAKRTAIRLLNEPALVQRRVREMQESVDKLYEALNRFGLQPVPSKANFVLFKAPTRPADFVEMMAGHGVLIRDMSGYSELRDYVRVCAGTSAENKAFLDALTKILDH
ncbi:MAG: histidinol-phosphate transaminase [Rhodothermia bacterium]|nr:histidinol-phosphate transaminase [Rhodothermia bacterium]